MDKEKLELLLHLTIVIATTLITGYIIFFVVVPDIDSSIQITVTNPQPFDIVDALLRMLPVAIVGSFIMLVIYYGRMCGGVRGV